MSIILVVDDSPIDRQLCGSLLAKDACLQLEFASGGREALERMAQSPPDLVLTDLLMPELDGLQLVGEIRAQFAGVPVILMTSAGNEEIAVEALQRGAASYVPKRQMVQSLLSTVQGVLALANRDRDQSRLKECLTCCEFQFELVNDCSLIGPLVGRLQDDLDRTGICDEADRMRIGIALDEALNNALFHGNLEVSSELRECDDRAFRQLAQQRAAASPYRERRIMLNVYYDRDEARFVVRDEGPGFDVSKLPDPTDPANLQRVSGRGVLLMRTFMDRVQYNEKGNEVTLVKLRKSC